MLLSRPIEPPDRRSRSPSGGSTLITSAPMSAICCVANGPSSTAVRSITFTPANGPGISLLVYIVVLSYSKTPPQSYGEVSSSYDDGGVMGDKFTVAHDPSARV